MRQGFRGTAAGQGGARIGAEALARPLPARAGDIATSPTRPGLRREPADAGRPLMAADWFESVAEAERRAAKRLPHSVHMAIRAGSERGVTLADNVAAFGELGFAPHMAGLSPKREQATVVMGQQISMPVLISPTGVQ